MNLKTLLADKRVVRHRTSKKEIAGLLAIADRDIKDARLPGLSADRKFDRGKGMVEKEPSSLVIAEHPPLC